MLKVQIIERIVHAYGITYVVPISYAYDGEAIIMNTHIGRKLNNCGLEIHRFKYID